MALATPTHHTETDGEVVYRVKHYSIYIVLGSLKQGPELELACHNSLYGSLANLTVLTGVPVWSSGIYLLNTTYGHRFSLLQFAIIIHLSLRLL